MVGKKSNKVRLEVFRNLLSFRIKILIFFLLKMRRAGNMCKKGKSGNV